MMPPQSLVAFNMSAQSFGSNSSSDTLSRLLAENSGDIYHLPNQYSKETLHRVCDYIFPGAQAMQHYWWYVGLLGLMIAALLVLLLWRRKT